MAHPSKRKGDQAEREAAKLLSDHLGLPVRRKLGAGRMDDEGDLEGVPDVCIEVKHRASVTDSVRLGLADLEREQANAGTTFGVCMVRLPGGGFAMVQTVAGWCALYREATS